MSLAETLQRALDARSDLLRDLGDTTCVRLLHGAVEGAPGTAIDRYGPFLLVQTWREPLEPGDLEAVHAVVHDTLGLDLTPVWNHRARGAGPYAETHDPGPLPPDPVGTELGVRFDVTPRHRGNDPLLFLDFRAGRRLMLAEAGGRSVLNLFAYTCGIGVSAAVGGASEAVNVDFAASALSVGQTNADLNEVSDRFHTIHFDALPVMRRLAGQKTGGRRGSRLPEPPVEPRSFDIVVLDPPRWAKSRWGAVDVVRDYPTLFKPAVLATAPGGAILATNHVPHVDLDEWLDVLQRCAAKAGRPLKDVTVIPPEQDFPSPDGKHPLKMAWCRV